MIRKAIYLTIALLSFLLPLLAHCDEIYIHPGNSKEPCEALCTPSIEEFLSTDGTIILVRVLCPIKTEVSGLGIGTGGEVGVTSIPEFFHTRKTLCFRRVEMYVHGEFLYREKLMAIIKEE